MPAKWSRPVFSFGFFEGKISQLLGDEVLAFERLRARRAIGDTRALHQVIDARAFDSAQVSVSKVTNYYRRCHDVRVRFDSWHSHRQLGRER